MVCDLWFRVFFRLSPDKWRDYMKVIYIKEFGLGFIRAPAVESYYRWCGKMKPQVLFGYIVVCVLKVENYLMPFGKWKKINSHSIEKILCKLPEKTGNCYVLRILVMGPIRFITLFFPPKCKHRTHIAYSIGNQKGIKPSKSCRRVQSISRNNVFSATYPDSRYWFQVQYGTRF